MEELKSNKNFAEFDYFGEERKDFYNKFKVNSILVQGEHWKHKPLVTILLPTYKRPVLLKQALDSALNQKGFDDYQILVVDNEGVPINEKTQTSRLMAQYKDNKILYYRHEKSVPTDVMDYAARLAKSKWICFLHDDDILAENHLSVLTGIVKKHNKIKFLACPCKDFINEISDEQFSYMVKRKKSSYGIISYPKHYSCTGYWSGWLGALIDRECYIDTGGMPTLATGLGDFIMVGKFTYRYGVYSCRSKNALYFYRGWTGQLSSSGTEVWQRLYENEYRYQQYVNRIYHKLFVKFWDRIAAYEVLQKCRDRNRSYYHTQINIRQIINNDGIPSDILSNKKRKQKDEYWLKLYRSIINRS
jgi:glycosyltransferase involved in cell wall biosynthesis